MNTATMLAVSSDGPGKGAALGMAVTLEQIALQYIALSEPRWGAHEVSTAKSVIRNHLIAKLGHLPVENLNAEAIQTFMDDMVRSNASDSLLNKTVTHLRAILDMALESGILVHNPMRSRASKIEHRSRRPASARHLSFEECGALLSELAGRDLLIVRMFVQLGLRPKEFFALRRNDVNGEFIRIDEVLIKGRIEKIGDDTALRVYVPPDLLLQLANWMQSTGGQEGDWLFPASRSRGPADLHPMDQQYFRNRVLKRTAEKVRVPDVGLLGLRRTCAGFFANKATAQDTLAQMRHYHPASTAESHDQGLSESLKGASQRVEAEILKAAKRIDKSRAETPIHPTSSFRTRSELRRLLPRLFRMGRAWSAHFEKYGCIGCAMGRPDATREIAARLRRCGFGWSAILADIGRAHMTARERRTFEAAVRYHLTHTEASERKSYAHLYGGGGFCIQCQTRIRRQLLKIIYEMQGGRNAKQ